ncbi:MAG: CRISPR-associated endonuclease Cas2 [Deltaproteobacteria bacterium]|nr:CRISPR-associated endonuclease Cas2 [Deltaproteobacteria bacterium]MBW1920185.1 CRISPR-associated endonuclease Cas2 [Deltaproteobacteria bacterium]MBW1934830.1 CRISPR-associated endonuclease Cas2 [Deltaproteobacteria bacterium]MBW2046375.1 CRISPR-associated endonuclease Cas2 [Deltaproteobacteria bacterium]MBW2299945.1 CRISPR-associated endonuclease Cas2 [Deltaproteobacteria bacterium]
MYILVSYDIVDDKTRSKVSKYLKDFGTRVQKSVFECDLNEVQFSKMKNGVERLINSKEDRVRYYPLCKQCVGRVLISGWGEIAEDEGFEVV